LYFYDCGVVTSLLGIRNENELSVSHFRGPLFENFIVMEIWKQIKNKGSQSELYYWKMNKGVEIDIIIDSGHSIIPIEVKSAQTYATDFEKNLLSFNTARGEKGGMIIYDGKIEFKSSNNTEVFNWIGLKDKLDPFI
jgi:predicted AAA+ superfamily ATPase